MEQAPQQQPQKKPQEEEPQPKSGWLATLGRMHHG
jgi:hypothetical protein